MTKQCKNLIERVEPKTLNSNQHMFDCTDPDKVYCSTFGDSGNSDDNLLPYAEEIQDQK